MKRIIISSSVIALPIFLIVYIFIPFILTRKNWWGISYENTGQIGDTFGGILGPMVGFLGVLATFWAFYIQYEANNEQREQFKKQELDLKIERFENRYFELIKIHRENVAEIGINNSFGRKVFVILLREFRETLKVVQKVCNETNYSPNPEQLIDITFLSFYYGTGPNSTRILKSALSNYPEEIINLIVDKLGNKFTKKQSKKRRKFDYTPFEGHQSRLGHYFRHLYHTVKYVDKQKLDINKYGYIKILRAQLSTHEQALLMFNSISKLGTTWEKGKLITKYRLIKHIPKDFFDSETEVDVKSIFPDLQFRWEETSESDLQY